LFEVVYRYLKDRPEGAAAEELLSLVLEGPGEDASFASDFLRGLLAEDPRFYEIAGGSRWSVIDRHVIDAPLQDVDLVVVDVETTGQRISETGITEIGAVKLKGNQIVDRFDRLVNPGRQIPTYVAQLTGISDAMVADAPPIDEVLPDFVAFARGGVLVAHNAAFDAALLDHHARRIIGRPLGLPCVCTLKLARRCMPELERASLDALREHFGIGVGNGSRHRALADAELTAEVLLRLTTLPARPPMATVADLIAAQDDPATDRRLRIRIPRAALERLPEHRGVYQLVGATGAALYVARADNVRRAVSHLFYGACHLSDRQVRLLSETTGVEARPVAGELEARIIEAEWIRKRQPEYNRPDRHLPRGYFVKVTRRGIHPRVVVCSKIGRDLEAHIGPLKGRPFAEETARMLSRAFGLPPGVVPEPSAADLSAWGDAAHALESALLDEGGALRARIEASSATDRQQGLAALGRLAKLRRGDRSWVANYPDCIVAAPGHDGAWLLFAVIEGLCRKTARIQRRADVDRYFGEVRRLRGAPHRRIPVLLADVSTILAHHLRQRADEVEGLVIALDRRDWDASLAVAEADVSALLGEEA
jgi:DNA polymerase III epsilon subunit family exonuclease